MYRLHSPDSRTVAPPLTLATSRPISDVKISTTHKKKRGGEVQKDDTGVSSRDPYRTKNKTTIKTSRSVRQFLVYHLS